MILEHNRLVQPIFKKITGNEKDKKRLDKSGWLRYNVNTCFLVLRFGGCMTRTRLKSADGGVGCQLLAGQGRTLWGVQ